MKDNLYKHKEREHYNAKTLEYSSGETSHDRTDKLTRKAGKYFYDVVNDYLKKKKVVRYLTMVVGLGNEQLI